MIFFRKFSRRTTGICMIGSGVLCVLVAAAWTIYSVRLCNRSLRATGHITQLILRHGDNGDFYFPVFTYTDQHNSLHTIYSSSGSYPPPNRVGDAVKVLYSTGAENNARIDEWITLWGIPIIIGSLGIVYIPVGTILYLWRPALKK